VANEIRAISCLEALPFIEDWHLGFTGKSNLAFAPSIESASF